MNDQKIGFRTKDLNLASFFWCQPNAKILKLDGARGRGNTIFFAFELPMTDEELQRLQIDYANGDTTVEPTMFCKKQNQLRDMLHASLGSRPERT
jgi:hypothetical protein